jgi:hypothetical protein
MTTIVITIMTMINPSAIPVMAAKRRSGSVLRGKTWQGR